MSLPERYRSARVHAIPDAMPDEWLSEAARWLREHRMSMTRWADPNGGWDLWRVAEWEQQCPDLAAPLRAKLLDVLPEAREACGVEPFDVDGMFLSADLSHHGQHVEWHHAAPEPAKLAFALTLYATDDAGERSFQGGEIEFVNGETVDPTANLLTVWDAKQRTRVRRVECWSAEVLHGRWSIGGGIS